MTRDIVKWRIQPIKIVIPIPGVEILKKFGLKLKPLLIIFVLTSTLFQNKAFASAWTKPKGGLYISVEGLLEEDEKKISSNSKTSYRTKSYKAYVEYGLFETITIGGYLKNYNFSSKYTVGNHEYKISVENDYYLNLFVIQNILDRNDHVFSLQYATYHPLSYDDLSKYTNAVDTKHAFELSLLYGKNSTFNDLGVYFNAGVSYKHVLDWEYDQMTYAISAGIRPNISTSFALKYEFKDYLLYDKLVNSYREKDISKIYISGDFKYYDNVAFSVSLGYPSVVFVGFTGMFP
jgi:hypothetical protein